MTESPLTRVAQVNGAALHYDVSGAGHPLILLHAGIADRRMWDEQVPAFARHFQVIRCDLRGYGETPMVAGPFSHAADLLGLMQALGVERAHLLGCSRGGTLALDLALAHPERVSALVLVTSAPSGYQPGEPAAEPPQWAELVSTFKAGNLERTAELEAEMWVAGSRRPEQVDPTILARVRAMDLIALTNEKAGLGQEQPPDRPAAGRLAEVAAPTLMVIGDLDEPFTVLSGEALAAGIPGARRVVVAGTAHLPNMEQPETFNRVVLEFLTGLLSGAAL